MSDAYKNWFLIHQRIAELHRDWAIYTFTFDHEYGNFTVVCRHGVECVYEKDLAEPKPKGDR